ncbi:MAG: type VI secretion system baseplate subunit TssG, partial [Planctomycetes bacterium]|nr:type VI secretion system baseplate subunit TssG [Planctomycetota bacterium]
LWSCPKKIHKTLGPLAGADVDGFMPGGAYARDLASLVARFNQQGLDWDLELIVASASLPPAVLGVSARLGWTTRLDGDAAAEYRITCSPARPAA